MTSQEFVIWLKGFTEAVHEYTAPTSKQWDIMKEKLEQVKDEPKSIGVPIGVPNYTPPFPPYTDPFNPYRVTCVDGVPNGTMITTTPGTGYITVANPYIASFSGTSTSTSYPSGSTISYTNSGETTSKIN